MRVLAQPKGLILDQNIIVPQNGAMRTATHVIVDQPGIVRARQTNDLYLAKDATDYRPRALRIFDGEAIAISSDGADWRIEDEGAVITGNATPPTQAQIPRMEEARSSLYHTSDSGIRKLISGDAATIAAGVEPHLPLAPGGVSVAPALGTTLAGGPLPGTPIEGRVYISDAVIAGDIFEWYKTIGATNYAVSVVVRRTDANGYVRRSPPARVYLAGSALPSTDAFLWQTYTVTAADVAAGYFVAQRINSSVPLEEEIFVPDTINDDLLGEALYTNPSQQGALGAKYAPPLASELALWSGCMWYGNTISKNRLTVSIVNTSGSTNTANVDDTNPIGLLGAITAGTLANVTTTNLSPNITGLSDDFEKFLRVGMYITDATNATPAVAGTAFPADTLLVSWTAGVSPGTIDLVVSKNATATGARDVLIGDVVSVGGRNFYAWAQDEIWSPDVGLDSGRRVFGVANTTITATGRLSYTAQTLAYAINYESIYDPTFLIRAVLLGEPYVYSSTVTAPADILLEEVGIGGAAFTVTCSSPDAMSPSAVSLTSESDTEPGRLWWSEIDEPEAVPLPNFFRVGRPDRAILALTPLRSGLLVWKTDGLYRVTGNPPDGWRVDAIDDRLRLITSGAVDVDDGYAYAWTDAGFVRATESGAEVVSKPIDELFSGYAASVLDDPTLVGSWVVAWRLQNLILVGLQGGGGAEIVLALSTVTGAWSTFWDRTPEEINCAAYDQLAGRLYWARESAWEIRRFNRECTGSDRRYTLTGATCSSPFTSVVVSYVNAGTWAPREGDWVSRVVGPTARYARIVSVTGGASDWTLNLDTALGANGEGAAFYGYEGLACRLDWQNVGPAGAWERIREIQAHVDGETSGGGPGTLYLAMGGSSSFSSAVTVGDDVALPTSTARPYRFGIPRAIGRNAHLFPRVDINALGYAWRLHAIAVVGDPQSDKVRR